MILQHDRPGLLYDVSASDRGTAFAQRIDAYSAPPHLLRAIPIDCANFYSGASMPNLCIPRKALTSHREIETGGEHGSSSHFFDDLPLLTLQYDL